jgi:hypothetical protein
VAQLAERIARVLGMRDAAGRSGPFDVCCGPFSSSGVPTDRRSTEDLVAELVAMGEAGAGWITVTPGGDSPGEVCERISAFAEEVAAPVRASLGH